MNERELTQLYRQWDPDPGQTLQKHIRARTGDRKTPLLRSGWTWSAVCTAAAALAFVIWLPQRNEQRLPPDIMERNASHYAYYRSLPARPHRNFDELNAVDFPYYQSLGEQI